MKCPWHDQAIEVYPNTDYQHAEVMFKVDSDARVWVSGGFISRPWTLEEARYADGGPYPSDWPVNGAWIVYSYDMAAYPIFLADSEVEAHRKTEELGYGSIKFWEFGTDWSDK